MANLRILSLFFINFLVIFCCITGTAFGISSTDNKSAQSGDSLNLEISNVHYSYYHYFFGLNSYGNTLITRYGKLPVLDTEEKNENWNSTLEELSNKIRDTIVSKYMYPNGEVMTCGANDKGYFVILFKYGNVDESLMNEVYSLIDNSAKEMGMQDVPVEFGYGIYREQIELGQGNHWLGESTENLSKSDIHIIEEYMKGKPEQLGDGDIANYGRIPLLKNENESRVWGDKQAVIVDNIRDEMDSYSERGLMSYGYGFTRLEVRISENLSSEEKTTLAKEIYQIIDEEARKQNVTDIPVVFQSKGEFEETNALLTSEEENDIELKNLSTNNYEPNNGSNSNLNSSNGSKSSKTNSIPGFGLLGSLTCLYGGWKLRRK